MPTESLSHPQTFYFHFVPCSSHGSYSSFVLSVSLQLIRDVESIKRFSEMFLWFMY